VNWKRSESKCRILNEIRNAGIISIYCLNIRYEGVVTRVTL